MIGRMLVVVVLAIAAAGTAAVAAGDGGPGPGVMAGWDGVMSPDGNLRYVAFPTGRQTTVAIVRVRGGRVARFSVVPGDYGVPLVAQDGTAGGLSADGRTLVLASSRRQARSRFVVLSARTLDRRRTIALRGVYSYDALSPDATTLYLIEYVTTSDAAGYRVRAYDLPAGRLLPLVITDRRTSLKSMSGYPVTRVSTRDVGWAYTLYSNPSGKPFVHALDTRRREAVCIDLPWRGPQNALSTMRLRLAEGGRRLMLLRRQSRAIVAVIDTRTFRVERR